MRFVLLLTVIAVSSAYPYYGTSVARNVNVNENGTIVVTGYNGKQVTISKVPGQDIIEITLTGPNLPTKTIKINDRNEYSGGYFGDSEEYGRDKRSSKAAVTPTSQAEILAKIFSQYQGSLDDVAYQKLLNAISTAVQARKLNAIFYEALQNLAPVQALQLAQELYGQQRLKQLANALGNQAILPQQGYLYSSPTSYPYYPNTGNIEGYSRSGKIYLPDGKFLSYPDNENYYGPYGTNSYPFGIFGEYSKQQYGPYAGYGQFGPYASYEPYTQNGLGAQKDVPELVKEVIQGERKILQDQAQLQQQQQGLQYQQSQQQQQQIVQQQQLYQQLVQQQQLLLQQQQLQQLQSSPFLKYLYSTSQPQGSLRSSLRQLFSGYPQGQSSPDYYGQSNVPFERGYGFQVPIDA